MWLLVVVVVLTAAWSYVLVLAAERLHCGVKDICDKRAYAHISLIAQYSAF